MSIKCDRRCMYYNLIYGYDGADLGYCCTATQQRQTFHEGVCLEPTDKVMRHEIFRDMTRKPRTEKEEPC